MIPLHDDNPTKSIPFFTYLLMGLNIYFFFFGALSASDLVVYYHRYGLVPYELSHFPVTTLPNIYTSMFIHSGFGHLAGNMLYMWIFANNIEDVLGKFRFLLYYFVCGTIAAMCHAATDFDSQIPMVGASGAISGILGGYLILFPYARIKTLVFLGFFVTIIHIRALVLLILWMVIQILSSIMLSGAGSGVAWSAHTGGFLAGMLLILPFKKMMTT